MESILIPSRKYQVNVLLATHNGAQYLEEFLDSLAAQVSVKIDLLVSDDSSTDETLDILQRYSSVFQNFTLFTGPKQGPCANFFKLISLADGDFIAFADQDDVWEKDHLVKSCDRIAEVVNKPVLSYSSVLEFDSSKSSQRVWPTSNVPQKMQGFFIQNYARGCTLVFNHELLTLLKKYHPRKAIMHDWWAVLVAFSLGEVVFSGDPELSYRLHDHNFTKPRNKKRLKLYWQQKNQKWLPLAQLEELYKVFGFAMTEHTRADIESFIQGFNGKLGFRLRFALTLGSRFRQSLLDEIIIRVVMVFYPLLFSTSNSACLDSKYIYSND